jgi:hypothetical protein
MSRCARCDYDGDLEQHEADSGHPVCYVCHRRSLPAHLRQTCAACVARTRADLADIENLYARLDPYLIESRFPANSGSERTAGSGDEQPIPGGDALIMLAWGGAGWDTSTRRGNRDHVADESQHDPQSVPGLLAIHEDDWRHQLRHPAAGPPSVAGSVAYLTSQLDRMAQCYSEFDTFAYDMHGLRMRLKTAVGLSERPVLGADCFDCGERLVRRYRYPGDQLKPAYDPRHGPGLEDHYTCERCDRTYTHAEYMLAVRSHHTDQAVGEWRPAPIAAHLIDRSIRTIRTWIKTPDVEVAVACRLADRRVVVWMPDVIELAKRTARRQRREAS